MRISKRFRQHRVRTGTMVSAAIGLIALSGASISTSVASMPSASAAHPDLVPGRQLVAAPRGRLQQPGAMRDHLDRHPRGRGQARVAHHLGEQVLRRDLHRPQPEQLPVADAAPAGSPADELLRHRSLQHGQLHLAGVRPVAFLGRAGRLLDLGEHDEQQQRDHHHRHGRHRHGHRPHDQRPWNQHHRTDDVGKHQRKLRPAPRARRHRRQPGLQRLRLPDRRHDPVQPVQRGRRLLEGLRPGPRGSPADGVHVVRDGLHPRRERHRARA